MTQTIQPSSWATLHEPHKDLSIKKPMTEETMKNLRSLADDLNEFQKELESITKIFYNLSDAGTDYLQATQKITQSLAGFIKDNETGGKR
jgi:uncharacterized protein YoxC